MEMILSVLLVVLSLGVTGANAQIVSPKGITAGVGDTRYVNVTGDTMTGALTIGGITYINDGSATAPGLTFISEIGANSGLYRSAENAIAITAGGLLHAEFRGGGVSFPRDSFSVGTSTFVVSAGQVKLGSIPTTTNSPLLIRPGVGGGIFIYESDADDRTAIAATATNDSGRVQIKRGGTDVIDLNGAAGTSSFFNIGTGGKLGIGTATPEKTLHVSGASTNILVRADNSGDYPSVRLQHHRGTAASPTGEAAGDNLGYYTFEGHDNVIFTSSRTAYMTAIAQANWSATNHSAHLAFGTTPNGSTGPTERLRITDAGNVGIGTTAPGTKLHISSSTIKLDGTGSPAAGKALCFTAAKLLGVCTDTPAADGSCTCN